MSRYVPIPATIALLDPATDQPVGSVSPRDVFRALFADQKIHQALGIFDAADLRSKLLAAKPGFEVVTDLEHQVLREACLKPLSLSAAVVYSPEGLAFLKGVIDAPEKRPADAGDVTT